jgi:hypothetical protein
MNKLNEALKLQIPAPRFADGMNQLPSNQTTTRPVSCLTCQMPLHCSEIQINVKRIWQKLENLNFYWLICYSARPVLHFYRLNS